MERESFDRSYFDAKFEGLEKLMLSQQENMRDHINAVSSNVKLVAIDLAEHKESAEAHGRKAADGALSSLVAWAGLVIAGALALFEARKH